MESRLCLVESQHHRLLFMLMFWVMFVVACVCCYDISSVTMDTYSQSDQPTSTTSCPLYDKVKSHVRHKHKMERKRNPHDSKNHTTDIAVKIECPTNIQDGDSIQINCIIYKKNSLLRNCLLDNSSVTITHNIKLTLCSVLFDSQNCSSAEMKSQCNCSVNEDIFQYSYYYDVKKTRDENTSFRCNQICPGQFPQVNFSSCESIKIKERGDQNGGISNKSSSLHIIFLWLMTTLPWSYACRI